MNWGRNFFICARANWHFWSITKGIVIRTNGLKMEFSPLQHSLIPISKLTFFSSLNLKLVIWRHLENVYFFFRHKSCVPTASGVKNKSVPVWLYPAASSSPDCAVVNVEEHTECQCGCATDAMSCKRNQIFEESKCACTCLDQNARQACYRRPGWVWSEETCQCLCKAKKDWPQCATGSKFDPLETCSCVSYSEYAGSVLIIMVVVLSLGLITTISSLIICHRQKLGPFKHQRRDAVMEKIRRKSSANSNKNLPLISWMVSKKRFPTVFCKM